MIKKLFLVLLLCALASAQNFKPPMGTQIDWSHPLARGLVGCWLMNEGAGNVVYDQSGNGKTGTITAATWMAGLEGAALNLDGTGDYILVGSYIPAITATSDFTIHCKVKITARNGSQFILSQVRASGDRFGVYVNDSASCTISIEYYEGSAYGRYVTGTLSYGTWYDVCLINYADKTKAIFIDGVLNSGTGASGISPGSSGTNQFVFGASASAGASFLNGQFSYGSIYNRALSASEIAQLYREPFAMLAQETPEFFVSAGEEEPAVGRIQVIFISGIPVWVTLALVSTCVLDMRQRRRAA